MPTDALATLLAVLSIFQLPLTRPAYARFLVLAAGWILTQAPAHAVTEALVVTGVSGVRHWEAYHRFFSRGTWDPDRLGLFLLDRIRHLGSDGILRLVIDDTLCPKKGPEIFGLAPHIDPVRSTKKRKAFSFGHCWVVLAVIVRVPFSPHPWSLPVLFRLYRPERISGAEHASKPQLAHQMLTRLLAWLQPRPGCPLPFPVHVALDQGYANRTVVQDLHQAITFIGGMRTDAALTSIVPKGPGQRRKKGDRLPTPKELANDPETPWSSVKATLYGRTERVYFKALQVQWYWVCGPSPLQLVVVRCENGDVPIRAFFSTDPLMTVRELLEGYASRWSIEVAFRALKQFFGFADSQARKKESVLRVAPWVGMLYNALVLWFVEIHPRAVVELPKRPWYVTKEGLCFTDILRAARQVLTGVDILAIAEETRTLSPDETLAEEGEQLTLPWAA